VSYALLQHSGGDSYVNAAATKTLALRIGNADRMTVTGTLNPKVAMVSTSTIEATNFIDTSDIRKKKQVKPVQDKYLKNFNKIDVVQYKLKKGDNKELQFGAIAQQVQPYYPSLVSTDTDGMLGISYRSIAMLNVKKTQQQEERIDDLEKQIKELKKLISKL
jgi:hypothetical protein